jgi:hypothetical protein
MSQLPTIKRTEAKKETGTIVPVEAKLFKPEFVKEKLVKLALTVPASKELPLGYMSDRLTPREMRTDVRLSRKSTINSYCIMRGLQESGCKLENGAEIRNRGDVVRWLFENLIEVSE